MAIENGLGSTRGGPTAGDDLDKVKKRASDEATAASRVISDAETALGDKASKLASAARDTAAQQSEDLKDSGADAVQNFADAIRSAGDELARKQPGMVADLVRQAAGGLEALSKGLHQKSAGDMLNSVRDFGRQNPAAFVAGSVLAGFALGRFAGSSSTRAHNGNGHDRTARPVNPLGEDDGLAPLGPETGRSTLATGGLS